MAVNISAADWSAVAPASIPANLPVLVAILEVFVETDAAVA